MKDRAGSHVGRWWLVFTKRRLVNMYVALALSLLSAVPVLSKDTISQPTYEVVEQRGVMVPLSDGTRLATNTFLPIGEGPWPTILLRTPYDKDRYTEECQFFARRGYAYVAQDTRGRFDSEGVFDPFMTEGKDGYEVQDWVAAQPWCSGLIGTYGASYSGVTQWLPAPRAHPALRAMFAFVTAANVYELIYYDGAFELGTLGQWAMSMTDPLGFNRSSRDVEAALQLLPLLTLDIAATGREVPFLRRWLAHPTRDTFWDPVIVDDAYENVKVPVYNATGWYDFAVTETINNYVGMIRSAKSHSVRRSQKLLIGPWLHSFKRARTGEIGGMDFGPHSLTSLRETQLRWFDATLKNMDNGIIDEPPVRIFVMGENQWRNENEWPLMRTQPTQYFLHSVSGANGRAGDGMLVLAQPDSSLPDSFTYDPRDPVPTTGGAVKGIPGGPYDQSEIEDRTDVLVFSTEILARPVEVTGHIKLVLFASSDARNTDFTAKLVDVHPTGYAQNLCDGIVRATHRDSDTETSLITPGEVYRYEIDVGVTSNLFLAGHRIRLEVSSSNFPRFDRNPNTGNPFAHDAELVVARQVVYHDGDQPSHLILPVIPR